jgi:hypothetical protein
VVPGLLPHRFQTGDQIDVGCGAGSNPVGLVLGTSQSRLPLLTTSGPTVVIDAGARLAHESKGHAMRMSRTVIVSLVALGLVGLLAFGAWAVTNDDDGFGRGGPWQHEGGWGDRGGWGGHWGPDPEQVRETRADLAADLAAQLDTSAEEVEAAFRGVAEQRLQEAVADGRIDQAEADEALAAYDDGDVAQIFRIVKGGRTPTAEGSS